MKVTGKIKAWLLLAASVMLLTAFGAAVYGLRIEPYWLKVKHLKIESPKLREKLRIVFASDIHFGIMYDERHLADLAARINEQKPDIVILGGDQIMHGRNITERFYRNFALLVDAPVYAVLGNHDYPGYDSGEALAEIAHSGIISLDNKAYDVKGLRLAGVGDLWLGAIDLRPMFRELGDDTFLLAISHNPEMADYLTKYAGRIDLMLSGHLHGRQINIFGVPLLPRRPRVKGNFYGEVKLTGGGLVYITSGVGTSNLPMRFLARPEIVVVELDGASGS